MKAKVIEMERQYFMPWFCAAGLVIGSSSASGQTFLTYHCRDGSEFVVAFVERDRSAYLQLDGKAVSLRQRLSLSGSRYAKGDISLRITKTGTTLVRGRRSTDCTA